MTETRTSDSNRQNMWTLFQDVASLLKDACGLHTHTHTHILVHAHAQTLTNKQILTQWCEFLLSLMTYFRSGIKEGLS